MSYCANCGASVTALNWDESHLCADCKDNATICELRAENARLAAELTAERGNTAVCVARATASLAGELAEAQGLVDLQLAEIKRLKDAHEAEIVALRQRMVAAESELARVKPLWEQQLNAEREAHARTRAELERIKGFEGLVDHYRIQSETFRATAVEQQALSIERQERADRAEAELITVRTERDQHFKQVQSLCGSRLQLENKLGRAESVLRGLEAWASECQACGGYGMVSITVPAHDSGCDGSCRNCPVPIEDFEPCPCGGPRRDVLAKLADLRAQAGAQGEQS